jgi:RNA-binding protein
MAGEQVKTKRHSFRSELSSTERKKLRGLAHGLKPVVQVGSEGTTPGVIKAIQEALQTHELIKVQLPGQSDAEEKTSAASALCAQLGKHIHLAGRVGRMAVLYLEKDPAEARITIQSLRA